MTGVSGCTALGQVLPEHDLQCPMLSLPLAFKTTLNSIPAATGYLQVDAARRTHWQQVLGAASGLRVGLVASGDPRHARDAQRSLGLAALLGALPADIQMFCLQRVAHLSAALGCPTWVLLAHVPDWRWLLAREDSPWYTSVRLLRQSQAGQWGDVLQRLAEEIRK